MDLGYLFIMFYLENYTDLIFRDVYQPWIQGFTSTTQGVYWNLMSVGLTNCIHDLSKLKVLWSSGGGGISRNAEKKKPKTFFVVSTCFSKTSSFDDIWLERTSWKPCEIKMIGWKPLMKCSRLVRLSDPVAALDHWIAAVSRPQTWQVRSRSLAQWVEWSAIGGCFVGVNYQIQRNCLRKHTVLVLETSWILRTEARNFLFFGV